MKIQHSNREKGTKFHLCIWKTTPIDDDDDDNDDEDNAYDNNLNMLIR